jgi:hypothetical protein
METAGGLPMRTAVARPERDWPRMDTPNVLWFFGAFAIAFATLTLIDKVPESHRDVWELLVSLGFYLGYALVGFLLLRFTWWVPGGLGFALAVAMVPAVGFGIASLVGTFPKDPFFDPFQDGSWSVVLIGIATMLDALISFAITRFSFLFFTFVTATLITAEFFLPTINSHPGGDAYATTAIVTGAALVLIGLVLDIAGRRRDAFWFHVGGFFGIAVALGYYATGATGHPNHGWVPMIIAGGTVLLLAAPLRRATWAVYGLLGFYVPIFHWTTSDLNSDSTGYALILLGIGISIFVLGMVLHRFGRIWTRERPGPPAGPPATPATEPPPAPGPEDATGESAVGRP